MKLAILGCSGVSTGELTLVFDWMRRLTRPVKPFAIVSEASALSLRWTGAELHTYPKEGGAGAVVAIDRAIEAIDPDVLLVADLLLLYLASPEFGRLFRAGLNLLVPVLNRARGRCRVIALDVYDWDANADRVDLLGKSGFRPARAPADVGRLLPSPYLSPEKSEPGRGRYAMMLPEKPCSKRERRKLRKEMGLGDGPLVFLTSSPWQHLMASSPLAGNVTRAFLSFVMSLLEDVGARIGGLTLLHLGPEPLRVPPEVRHLRYEHTPQLPPERFVPLVSSVDLMVSGNCIGTTNLRAASMQVPVACLHSGPTVGGARASPRLAGALQRYLAESEPRYPFSVWPLGMHSLMQAIMHDNPFEGIQAHYDVLDPEGAAKGIASLLSDASVIDELKLRQKVYFDRLTDQVDSPDDALSQALAG